MQIQLSLAGFASPWSFCGSSTFSAWAEARPWANQGALCVLRTETAATGDLLLPWIEGFVHGVDAGASRLDVRHIECGGRFGTPVQAMFREFELDPSTPPFEARDRIKARLLDRKYLLVFRGMDVVAPREWHALVNLLEYYRKAARAVPLAAIVIDHQTAIDVEPVCDFRRGGAWHPVLSESSALSSVEALWTRYAHHRVAWEAGGSVDHALSLSQAVRDCVPGDDEGFERRLQDHAVARLSVHEGKGSLEALHGVRHDAGPDSDWPRRNLQDRLFAQGLLWRPPGMNGMRVAPWASRGLLGTASLPRKHVWELRHQLVCAPIASEILALCLKFESHIHARLCGRRDADKAKEGTIDHHRRFKSGGDDVVVYPLAHPAPPMHDEDVWAFASWGENLRSAPSTAVRDIYRKALKLRNAIAHGHYVCWRQVKLAHNMLQSFD